MVLIHATDASELARRCQEALSRKGIALALDHDPAMDPHVGHGVRLSSYPGEDLEAAVLVVRRIIEAQ